ncbi:hypothetical protein [Sunxiuqinia sp. sy24]|uniref:hypothetical protein n=1 Tax=Sunxiuqinia sp. sy24 TaxID=3461495 RepID=UPI0040456155
MTKSKPTTERLFDRIVNKLRAGQTVFLRNDFYGRVIMSIPGTHDYRAKSQGGSEYKIDSSTDLVIETMDEGIEISEREYLNY